MTPLHVLVISRGSERRDALVTALRVAGHQVVSVPDAPAAAEAIGSPGFDALVLDLGWPELEPARLREALAPADAPLHRREPPACRAAAGHLPIHLVAQGAEVRPR